MINFLNTILILSYQMWTHRPGSWRYLDVCLHPVTFPTQFRALKILFPGRCCYLFTKRYYIIMRQKNWKLEIWLLIIFGKKKLWRFISKKQRDVSLNKRFLHYYRTLLWQEISQDYGNMCFAIKIHYAKPPSPTTPSLECPPCRLRRLRGNFKPELEL